MGHPDYRQTVTLDQAERALTSALLGSRRRARRGRGQQLTPYVSNVRKAIERGHAKPCRMIAAVLLADLAAGTPLDQVREFSRVLDALICASARLRAGVPVLALEAALDAEEPCDAAMDHAQWRISRGHRSRADKLELRAWAAAEAEHCLAIVASLDHDLHIESVA